MIYFHRVPYGTQPVGSAMENDSVVQNYLHQADEADMWAQRTQEPLLQARWRKLAKEYRELAQSRMTLLESRGLSPQQTVAASSRSHQ